MAAHVFNLGSLDLADYLKVHPEDGFDPFDPDFYEPQFGQNPVVEGGVLVNTSANLKEGVWPLALTGSGADAINALRQQINVEVRKSAIRIEWREPGATFSTFFDVVAGRLEPANNYFRQLHGWADHVLRLWVRPYGHTATSRIVATAAGSGALITVPVASLGGDVPAVLDARVTAGGVVPSAGRVVAVAALPHPSYAPVYPAASIGDRQTGATLVGASGAHASQYLGLPVSPTGASGVAAMVPLAVPSTYQGVRSRVFGLARSRLDSGVAIRMFDPFGGALGPTALATSAEGFGLIDLGVLSVPSTIPSSFKLPVVAGGVGSGGVTGSPGLHLNAVFVLPEDNLALVQDRGGTPSTIAGDEFNSTWQAPITGGPD